MENQEMENQNLAGILNHRGKKIFVSEWRKGLKNLTAVENKVLDARLKGKSFSEFTENETALYADQIILRCSTVVGCELPFTELFTNALSEQIIRFILDFGYENLTYDEVILAIEVNLPTSAKLPSGIDIEEIPFTGRCMNVAFLAKILKNYYCIRHLLDRKIQNLVDETNNF